MAPHRKSLSARSFCICAGALLSSSLTATACSTTQSSGGEVAGGVPSHQALYRQMDALRDYSCKSLHADMSNADSRKRTEDMAKQWLQIDQAVAAEREKDRAARSDRPHPSVVLSSYWTQWQRAVDKGGACFDVKSLSSADAEGGYLRANGNGSWAAVTKAGAPETALPSAVLSTCSTPEKTADRGFERCAMAMLATADTARK